MSEPGSHSTPYEAHDGPLTLAIVDQSQTAMEQAHDEAGARLAAELNSGSRLKRFVKGIWKGSIAYDFYEQRYKRQAQNEIVESQNILVHETDAARSERAHMATIQRFQSEYDETIHTEAGENRQELGADSEVSDALKGIIRRYVNGELDDEALREEKTRAIAAYRDIHGSELLGQGLVSIDNTLAIARAVKGAVEHGESLDRVMDEMKVVSGEARSGVRTDSKLNFNRVDRLIDKVNNSRIGSLVQPETVIGGTAIAACIARLAGRSTFTKAAVGATSIGTAIIGAPAVVTVGVAAAGTAVIAGMWAGAREAKRLKGERSQHIRDMAKGKEFASGDIRREELEQTRYQTATANELIEALQARFEPEALENPDALQAALDQLSAVEARIYLSDSRKKDFITYSASENVEVERLALDIARAQAKTTLNHRLDPDVRRSLGLDETADLDDILRERAEMFIGYTENDITVKNENFRDIRERAMKSAIVKGAVTSLAFGVLAQELTAAIADGQAGLGEHIEGTESVSPDSEPHQTLLHALLTGQDSHDFQLISPADADSGVTHINASDTYAGYDLGDHGFISISNDHTIEINQDGTIDIIDGNGHVTINDLEVNPDGTFPQESIDILESHGMTVSDLSYETATSSTGVAEVSVHEYMAQHQDDTLHVQRDLYYFNETPPDCVDPNSDLNELGLGWGGENGTGVAEDGGYQMSVASMTEDGSFQNGVSVNWQEAAANGDLRLLVTPTADMQSQPIVVPINPDGTIDIAPGSPAAEFFSVDENGHAVINAAFVEVAQTTDVDASGVTHVNILATAPGTGDVTTIETEVVIPGTEEHAAYKITTGGYDEVAPAPMQTMETVSEPVFTDIPIAIPLATRRPLEAARPNRMEAGRYGYYYGDRYLTAAERRAMADDTSPRLLENPNARLNARQELKWYKNLVKKKRGKSYVSSIDTAVASSPELKSISPSIKSLITIPVNAAGVAESNNIYELLHAYARQDSESLAHNMMLLHVNWSDTAAGDPAKKALIDRTRSEIERAKADFPQLKIATIETEWDSETYKDGVIGFIGRKMNDTALFAIETAMNKGQIADDHDVLIIRNDADAKGVHRGYLKHFLMDADRYEETDVFTGTTSFDNTKAHELPGMVLASNFERSLNLIETSRGNLVNTAGANFGVRASVMAAVGSGGFDDWNGAGSDDVGLGNRIQGARGGRYSTYGTRSTYGGGKSSRLSRLLGRKNNYYSGGSSAPSGTKRRIARRVAGARIDTDSDREEALYRNGKPMILTWNDGAFDRNGYTDRDADLKSAAKISDDPTKHPDEVLERVRADMEGSINFSRISEATVRTALTFMFHGLKPGTTAGYELRQEERTGSDGIRRQVYALEFTAEGKQHLLDHLQRDSKGRFDPYGNRKMRQLYGEVKSGSRRPPRNPAPLFRI